MHAVLHPGDHVIVHWPCYQSLFEIARSIGCEVTFWEARLENKWALDLDELKRSSASQYTRHHRQYATQPDRLFDAED